MSDVREVSYDQLGLSQSLICEFTEFVESKIEGSLDIERAKQLEQHARALSKKLSNHVGDSCQVAFIDIEGRNLRVIDNLNTDPFTKEFIFERRYVSLRNKPNFYPDCYRTYLTRLLRYEISKADKEKIFSEAFDLGNGSSVPIDKCTEAGLAKELLIDAIDIRNRPFKAVEEGIERILRCELLQYKKTDPSKTYKVIKLLYKILKTRHNRLFHFLTIPETSYSLEVRDTSPLVDGDVNFEEAVWLLADLKAYLSIELEESTFLEIQMLFDELSEFLWMIDHRVQQVFVNAYGDDYGGMRNAYELLTKTVNNYSTIEREMSLKLDEDLVMHLHLLEFFHFAVGAPKLFEQAKPNGSITSVRDELRTFTKNLTDNWTSEAQLHCPQIAIDEIPDFMEKHWEGINQIITKAMNDHSVCKHSTKIITQVHDLVHNFFWFMEKGRFSTMDVKSRKVSPWLCVSALCSVLHMEKNKQSHLVYSRLMPRKEGVSVPEPTRSLLTALSKSRQSQFNSERMTLEHRIIWRHRLEWFCDCLNGQSELLPAKFSLRSALVKKMMEIALQRPNRGDLNRELTDFESWMKATAFRISGTRPV